MRTGTALLLLALTAGCVSESARRPEQVHGIVEGVAADARQLLLEGRFVAALRAARAVDRLDPERGLEAAVRAELDAGQLAWAARPGAWSGVRAPAARPTWQRVALWLPDRVLDLLDVVSFDLAVGPGLRVDAHATRFLELSAGAADTVGAGWHAERSLGLRRHVALDVVYAGDYARYASLLGTRSGLVASGSSRDGKSPGDPWYVDLGDFWAVGASAHVVLVGASVDVHPLQVWDLLAGFVGLDPWDDDTARTRGWEPDQQMRLRLEALHDVLTYPAQRAAYHAWKQGAPGLDAGDARSADDAAPPASVPEDA